MLLPPAPPAEARLELGVTSWRDQIEEDRAPLANRRGVIEHAGLSLKKRLLELDVLAQVEEGAGAHRLDPLVDRLGMASTMYQTW